jgi:hypothetical protein
MQTVHAALYQSGLKRPDAMMLGLLYREPHAVHRNRLPTPETGSSGGMAIVEGKQQAHSRSKMWLPRPTDSHMRSDVLRASVERQNGASSTSTPYSDPTTALPPTHGP